MDGRAYGAVLQRNWVKRAICSAPLGAAGFNWLPYASWVGFWWDFGRVREGILSQLGKLFEVQVSGWFAGPGGHLDVKMDLKSMRLLVFRQNLSTSTPRIWGFFLLCDDVIFELDVPILYLQVGTPFDSINHLKFIQSYTEYTRRNLV